MKEHIKELKNKYPDDDEPLDEADAAFAYALLLRHPRAEDKISPGIAYFTIKTVPPWNKDRTFYIVWMNDRGGDWFSSEECLHPASQEERFRYACRAAISQDIIDFKNRCFDRQETWTCPLTELKVNARLLSRRPP